VCTTGPTTHIAIDPLAMLIEADLYDKGGVIVALL
jgi:hypothetical protein